MPCFVRFIHPVRFHPNANHQCSRIRVRDGSHFQLKISVLYIAFCLYRNRDRVNAAASVYCFNSWSLIVSNSEDIQSLSCSSRLFSKLSPCLERLLYDETEDQTALRTFCCTWNPSYNPSSVGSSTKACVLRK